MSSIQLNLQRWTLTAYLLAKNVPLIIAKMCNCLNTASCTSTVDTYKKSTAIKHIFGYFKEATAQSEQLSAHISSLKLISCHRSETSCHTIFNPQMVSLSPLTVVPVSGQTGEPPRVFTLGTQNSRGGRGRNQRDLDHSPLAASIV